jgi:biopolymer transport protein ExbD
VPQPAASDHAPAVSQDIVLTIENDGTVLVNQDKVSNEELSDRLNAIFKSTAKPIVFIRGRRDLAFQAVARVIDLAKGIGFQKIALMDNPDK